MTPNPALEPEDSLASDIIGVQEYLPETRKKKNFLPWHRPRKQFVRHAQWVEQINRMVDEVMPENNILKYLGLPGDDLLDLRYFHENICEPKNLQLKFLGFNKGVSPDSGERSELNISLDEVSKLSRVDPTSDVIGFDICQVANTDSMAWSKSVQMGPYDVINIDLCDGFGKHPPDQFRETHYNTLNQLMTLQARRVNPWLLLLTTRTGPEHIDGEVFLKLKQMYNGNLEKCAGFKDASDIAFTIIDQGSLDKVCESKKGISDVFLVSLCKWIASIIVAQNPPASMEVKSVIGYKVDPAEVHQDIVSLAIRISPTLVSQPDRIGLANQIEPSPNECNLAIQALDRVSKQRDADQILLENPKLMQEMTEMSSKLLEDARYEIEGYEDWLNN